MNIEWNKVTWYSKIAAVLVFVGTFFLGYCLGTQRVEKAYVEVPQMMQNTTDQNEYSSALYGLSFAYPTGYELTEHDVPGSAMRKHHVIHLIRKADLPLPVNSEGPPSIIIDIHQNDLDVYTTESWIKNSSASNFKLGEGVLASTTVGGMPALSYRWSGLYEGTTIALARPNWVYAFTVTYIEMGAPIVQDFVMLRESVRIHQ